MDFIGWFNPAEGRLARRPFALCVVAIYIAGFASQLLLVPEVTERAALWPFIVVQAALIWAWLVVHIRRLRDSGQGPSGAIGVALIYTLALGLLLMLILFLTNPNAVGPPTGGERPADEAAYGVLLVIVIFGLLFSPDFGVFTTILKLLIFIGCIPPMISLVFSVIAGMRESVAPAP